MKIKFEQLPPKPCAVCSKRGIIRFGIITTKGQCQVKRYACLRKGHAAQVVQYCKLLVALMEEERVEKESVATLRATSDRANQRAIDNHLRDNWRYN